MSTDDITWATSLPLYLSAYLAESVNGDLFCALEPPGKVRRKGEVVSEEEIGSQIVDSAINVHTVLGPGLLETAYERCLEYELTLRRLSVKKQVPMPLRYREAVLDVGFRVDLLVEDKVLVELKAVEKLLPVHVAQVLSYLRLGNYGLGFLLNFNTVHMRDGIRRVLNGMEGRY